MTHPDEEFEPPEMDGEEYNDSMTPDVTEKVEQTTTGYTFKVRTQRGTEVRDDDSVSTTAHYQSLSELESEREALTEATIEELNRLRSNQPDEEDGDGDE